MRKQITLFLVALFICNLGVFAQELPQITSIDLVGRGLGNTSFGHYSDFCAQESEGVFTWVGTLYHNFTNNEGVNQSFKCYVNNIPGSSYNEEYQLNASIQNNEEVEDGGTYGVTYSQKGSDTYVADLKWRLKSGGDGYYKITFNVLDPSAATMSLEKVDETYANLGSLSVEGLTLVQENDEEKGFDPAVYDYNCYISADATPTGVSYFAYRKAKVKFNGASTGNSYTYPVTVSGGDVSTVEVTGFDNATTKTYRINYKLTAVGIDRTDVSKVTYSVEGQILRVTGVDAYVVYSVNGTVAANVKSNASGTAVSLLPGVYVVKANTAEAFKVVIM